jgi:lipoprotein-releasing system permease protein
MYHPLSLWIGLRYLRAKRRNGFISFVSLVSIIGISLGVAALIIVISVMNGFRKEMVGRTLAMISHATISAPRGTVLSEWQEAIDVSARHPQVLASAPYAEREVMLRNRSVTGAMLRGILPEAESRVSEIPAQIKQGSLQTLVPGEFNAVIGIELAYKLGVSVGDKFTVYAPEFTASPVGALPQMKRFTVSGIFEVGMGEYDSGLLLIHLEDAQKLLRLGDAVTGVRLKLSDMQQAFGIARELAINLGGGFLVTDWKRQHANLFRAVATEKFAMFVILSLVVAIAAFNLVSSLVMAVTEKRADIAILRTLGAAPGTIQRIFIVQGMTAGVLGTLFGLLVGVLVTINLGSIVPLLERLFDFEAMPADVYYISGVPWDLQRADLLLITVMSLVFSLLATLYPSWRAARTQPAEALRYE